MEAARSWLPRGLGLVAFLSYALLCAPGLFWLDSGELAASAIRLGSAHPTGFPLYMLMAKLAAFVPIGELAFRVNLLSALCAAFAVAGVARLILALGQADWATILGAFAGAATLAVSLLFARQATVTEVYAPTAAFIVLTLLIFERVARGGTAAAGLSLAWVAGMGLAMHPSYRILMGLPILALLLLRLYRGARWPLLAPAMTSFSALASYLYLPVRAATGRIESLEWGHPDTFGRALAHANASEIRKAFADRMMSGRAEIVSDDLRVFAEQIADSLGLLAVLAAVLGLLLLLLERRTRWLGCALASIVVLDGIYGFWLNPMGLVDLQNGVPMVLGMCVCAGVAVSALARMTGPAAPFVGSVACLALVIPPALVSLPAVASVRDLPRAASEAAFGPVAPGAVILTQSDSTAAASIYLHEIEGARPDVAVLVLPMISDLETVREVLNATAPPGHELPTLQAPALVAIAQSARPMYWESGPIGTPANTSLLVGPMLSRLVPRAQGALELASAVAALRKVYSQPGHRDRSARRALANQLTNLGRLAFADGQLESAGRLFEDALDTQASHAAAWVNLGVLYSQEGQLEKAALVTEKALSYEPNRPLALVNAARYRMLLHEDAAALQHAERALRVDPKSPSSWKIAGLVDLQAGRLDSAATRLRRALAMAPEDAEAVAALRAIAARAATSKDGD